MLMTEAMDRYKKHLRFRNLSTNTINGYMKELKYLRVYLEEKMDQDIQVEDISLEDIEDFIGYKKDRGIVASSVNRFISIVKGFYGYLIDRNFVELNPTTKLQTYRILNRPKRDVLTEDEIDLLVAAIDDMTVRYIVLTMANTGLRISEASKLKLHSVNFENRLIYVIDGKGGKDRMVPMNNKLYLELKKYVEEIRPDVNSNYFFSKERTGGISRQWTNLKIKEAVESLGWKKNISSHNLRHSFATNLISNDVNIVSVQKLLGHSDLRTTSIYLHQSLDDLKNAVKALDIEEKSPMEYKSIDDDFNKMVNIVRLLEKDEDDSIDIRLEDKVVSVNNLLSNLIVEFSKHKNISLGETIETAVLEYIMKYGYKVKVDIV